MAKMPKNSKTPLLFFAFLILFLALRLFNLQGYLYFIYDQGRDMAKLAAILAGDITLVGPTTGIPGLFLGPLWYYVGLPGFVLTKGDPIGLSIWYILISTLAFPGFWWMSHQLFWTKSEKRQDDTPKVSHLFGWLCLILLIILPGSIDSSTTIWNVLMAAPLMLGALYSFWQVRQSQKKLHFLGLGFLLVGLTLQSEFAYAVFFIPVLVVAIPWMMGRLKVTDFLVAGVAGALTLIPQIVFELRHQFIMTTSLFAGLTDRSKTVTWLHQLQNRPHQLLNTSVDFFDGPDRNDWWLRLIVLGVCLLGLWSVGWLTYLTKKAKKDVSPQLYLKQLVAVLAVVPYPFFLLWRGNEGNFFSYYMTPHFVFVVPLFVLGLHYIVQKLWPKNLLGKLAAGMITVGVLLPITMGAIQHWTISVFNPVNEAGFDAMTTAIGEAYKMQNAENSATIVLTPNIDSVHYDYLFHWYERKHHLQPPRTVQRESDTQLILVIEQWGPQMADVVVHHRKGLTKDYKKKRSVISGMVTVEEWVKQPR